jgi:ketosteroid isomerase-like protein
MSDHQQDPRLRAVDAFLAGLTTDDVGKMPFADDVLLASPLDPDHPLRGKAAAIEFLKTRVFPVVPVRTAEVERHLVDGEYVATLWTATITPASGGELVVPIFDFFRIVDGQIKELRPYFDPQPLQAAIRKAT